MPGTVLGGILLVMVVAVAVILDRYIEPAQDKIRPLLALLGLVLIGANSILMIRNALRLRRLRRIGDRLGVDQAELRSVRRSAILGLVQGGAILLLVILVFLGAAAGVK